MKKLIYIILLTLFVVFPINVVNAAGSLNVSTNSLTVKKGETNTFNIVVTNAFCLGDVTSQSTSIATISSDKFETGAIGSGETKNIEVSVTGVKVGTTKITVTPTNCATFDREYITKSVEVTINVTDNAIYTIIYDVNGGTGGPTNQTKTEGTDLILSTTKPTRTGFSFVSWNTKKDGSGVSYAPGSKYTTEANATLYAQWTPLVTKYTVTFNTMSGTPSSISSIEAQVGTTIPLPSVTRSGYEFLGWSTSTNENDIVGDIGDSYKPESNVTLYAIWKENTVVSTKYTVTFNTMSGTPSSISSMETQVGATISLPSVTRSGYEFLGWSTSTNENDIVGDIGDSYKPESNVTLYAIWKENTVVSTKYTITYNANGGKDAPANQTKNKDENLTLSSKVPIKDKYEFIEWNTKKDGTGDRYQPKGLYTSNGNVTLYAQWRSVGEPDENPNTGDSAIFIILAIAVTLGGYSYWYTKKSKES